MKNKFENKINPEPEKEPVTVTRASLPDKAEYDELISRIWENHWLTNMGMYHEELKRELKERLATGGVELFVNGHMALELCIQALVPEGEIITTPFTFASTSHAIARNRLKPVFCDIKESDCTIDPDRIEKLITADTHAIVPVHVYGNICDFRRIGEIAREYGLKVIYDAAHAFGETVTGSDGTETGVGNLGDASMFSFHATKVFNTIEGGCITWSGDDPDLADRLYKLKNFGITGKESIEYIGGNGKMNEFCAAMGLCNLRHVDEWIEARKKVAERYEKNLSGISGIRLLEKSSEVKYNYIYMPVVFDGEIYDRDEIYDRLIKYNIYSRKYFYPCLNTCSCYDGICGGERTETAWRMAESILTLPIYPELPLETVDKICEIITG